MERKMSSVSRKMKMDGLDTNIVGSEVRHFEMVSSTNLVAKELAKKGAEDGVVVVADVQTEGRGRKERKWSSPEGGLWFSVILHPKIPPQKGAILTMAASIGMVEGIDKITGLKPKIKWPNDVLIKEKKICGILTEMDAKTDRINFAVVGIGINVNNKLEADLRERGTTLLKEMGTKIPMVPLFKAILESFDKAYGKVVDNDYDFIIKKWSSFSSTIGRKVEVSNGNGIIKGIATGIDEDGCLIVKDGETHRVTSGDVNYL